MDDNSSSVQWNETTCGRIMKPSVQWMNKNSEIPMAFERKNAATNPNNTRKRKLDEIKKEEKLNRFETIFSKRKLALFNKVIELSILCQTKAALIITSPDNNKLYASGYPNFDTVIQRFLTGRMDYDEKKMQEDDGIVETLRLEYEAIQEKLKQENEKLQAVTEEAHSNFPDWWNHHSIDDMDLGSLQEFKTSLEKLKLNLVAATEAKKFKDCQLWQ